MGLKIKTKITIRIHPIIFLHLVDIGNSSPSKVQRSKGQQFSFEGSKVQGSGFKLWSLAPGYWFSIAQSAKRMALKISRPVSYFIF
jgi:hypothetical protein